MKLSKVEMRALDTKATDFRLFIAQFPLDSFYFIDREKFTLVQWIHSIFKNVVIEVIPANNARARPESTDQKWIVKILKNNDHVSSEVIFTRIETKLNELQSQLVREVI